MRVLIACLWLATVSLAADISLPIFLWPSGAPGEKGDIGEETHTPGKNQVAGKPFDQLANVTKPTITVYHPPKEKDTGAAVVVFPGGSYQILAVDMEGIEACQWLNSIGISGVLLRYRVPARTGRPRYAAPLEDAQRALGMVRAHAEEWHLDAKRIGILGFSAGGHLGAMLNNNFEKRVYDSLDGSDRLSCRPDFTLLIYPAYLTERGDPSGKLAPEVNVTANTPQTFLVQAEDDPVRVENSLFYYLALKNAKVPAEMHLFATGGHGYGLRPIDSPVATWPQHAERWLKTIRAVGTRGR
ncbi:MAG TPA: alpha/beta hydrolase [Candidatus Acidoferrales bacterium]|jgi:acetyl esterase/lipase|nr:alpha/beta hydrolase [Candidatus Acidoferrales bacterium]